MKFVKPGERVLITGGSGSLGYELTERLTGTDAKIRIFSRDEKKQYDMKKLYPDCEYYLGDMRDKSAVRDVVRDVDVIIHGASLKYVNISEVQPYEYVATNVIGTMNLIDAILEEGTVRRVIGISTDKACLPVNAYGLTKALLEKVMLEGNRRQGEKLRTLFNVARYGNVVGTRGSVVPFWGERKRDGLTLPITNPDMTRFFFTLEEAAQLVDYALQAPEGLIISKMMRSCTLGELANVMAGEAGVEIMGERPGEKEHELLLSDDEMSRSIDKDGYLLFDPSSIPNTKGEAYGSFNAPRIPDNELKELINEWN